MSKSLSFIKKFHLFRLYLKSQSNGVIISCGICDSIDITFNQQSETKQENNVFYKSVYTCQSCGATCKHEQQWAKK